MANQTTTVSFVQVPANAVATRIMDAVDGDPRQVLAKAQAPTADAAGYMARLFNLPDIIAEGVVDNESTPVATELVDLTDKGVTFPATTMRLIRWRHWLQTDNDRYLVDSERWVLGGTTPVLLGERKITHAHGRISTSTTEYGLVKYKAAVATGATTESTTESGANLVCGDFTNGVATLTLPLNRTATCLSCNFAAATYGASTGAVPHVVTTSASTTGRVDLGAPDDG